MARKQTQKKPLPIEPEEESQESPDDAPEAEAGDSGSGLKSPNKSKAARQAIEAGYEKPGEAVEYIKRTFGINMKPQHFSAIKSNHKKKQDEAVQSPARKSKPASPKADMPLVVSTKKRSGGESDVMTALENVKELVDQYGAAKVKRMVDLLG